MTAETFLSRKLRRFDVVDYILVMLVYYICGLFIVSYYPPLRAVGWWFYLILLVICAFPLMVHLISQSGDSLVSKIHSCVKSNAPALQVLLALAMFFLACMVVSFIPALIHIKWWVYVILIVIISLKPLQKTWFW